MSIKYDDSVAKVASATGLRKNEKEVSKMSYTYC